MTVALPPKMCLVCDAELSPANAFECSAGHVLCHPCFSRYIIETWVVRAVELDEVPVLCCSVPGCTTGHLLDTQVARNATEEALGVYLDVRQRARDANTFARARRLVEEFRRENISEAELKLLEEQLRHPFPEATMRSGRRTGPIDARRCDDQRVYNGQHVNSGARISNSCPKCEPSPAQRSTSHAIFSAPFVPCGAVDGLIRESATSTGVAPSAQSLSDEDVSVSSHAIFSAPFVPCGAVDGLIKESATSTAVVPSDLEGRSLWDKDAPVWVCAVCGKGKALRGSHLNEKTMVQSECWPCAKKQTFVLRTLSTMSALVSSSSESALAPPVAVAVGPPHERSDAPVAQPSSASAAAVCHGWPCPSCTYDNPVQVAMCNMCGTLRPACFAPAGSMSLQDAALRQLQHYGRALAPSSGGAVGNIPCLAAASSSSSSSAGIGLVPISPALREQIAAIEAGILFESDSKIPVEFICPITQSVMDDPVITSDGHSYQRSAIKQWFSKGNRTSPLTGLPLPDLEVRPNFALRSMIGRWQQSGT